jgi:dihydrofolate reductase
MSDSSQRRLVQSALVSINGVISEPMSWAGAYFGDGSAARSLRALRASDGFLMGRRTYEVFSRQWPNASGEYADYLNAMPKYVFSSTLEKADWTNTSVVTGDVATTVARLKRQPGNDLIMYGHGQFGQTLIEAGLVDELTLTVVPVFVDGVPFFRDGGPQSRWELVNAGPGADPGLASLTFRPAGSALPGQD